MKLKDVSFYRKSDGYITHQLSANDDQDLYTNLNLLSATHGMIHGHHDPACHRVDPHSGTVHEHVWPQASRSEPHRLQRAIHSMETNMQPRAQRELLIALADKAGVDATRLKDVDKQIATARTQLSQTVAPDDSAP